MDGCEVSAGTHETSFLLRSRLHCANDKLSEEIGVRNNVLTIRGALLAPRISGPQIRDFGLSPVSLILFVPKEV